jgi:hypothetical protein
LPARGRAEVASRLRARFETTYRAEACPRRRTRS